MELAKSQTYFSQIQDTKKIPKVVHILRNRLPQSCFMINQLLNYETEKENLSVYFYNSDGSSHTNALTWILLTLKREDWGTIVSVSEPSDTEFSSEVQLALEYSYFVTWTEPFVFLSQNTKLTDFVIKCHIHKYFNIIKVYPNTLFAMNPEKAATLNLDLPSNSEFELKSLDSHIGMEFLTSNWKYTAPGTKEYMTRNIKEYVSGGIFLKGEDIPVCGALLPNFGLLGSLSTLPEHRRKGFGSLVTKFIYKQAAERGYYPCLNCEINAKEATAFQKSLEGHKAVGRIDYICHKVLQ